MAHTVASPLDAAMTTAGALSAAAERLHSDGVQEFEALSADEYLSERTSGALPVDRMGRSTGNCCTSEEEADSGDGQHFPRSKSPSEAERAAAALLLADLWTKLLCDHCDCEAVLPVSHNEAHRVPAFCPSKGEAVCRVVVGGFDPGLDRRHILALLYSGRLLQLPLGTNVLAVGGHRRSRGRPPLCDGGNWVVYLTTADVHLLTLYPRLRQVWAWTEKKGWFKVVVSNEEPSMAIRSR